MKSTASDVLFVIEVQNRIFMNTHTSSLMDCFDKKKGKPNTVKPL